MNGDFFRVIVFIVIFRVIVGTQGFQEHYDAHDEREYCRIIEQPKASFVHIRVVMTCIVTRSRLFVHEETSIGIFTFAESTELITIAALGDIFECTSFRAMG